MQKPKKSKWNFNPLDDYQGRHGWVLDRTIFLTVHGSRAYGTELPDSDIDIKGLCIPPNNFYYGFRNNFEQVETNSPYDMVVYGLRKFFKLGAEANPNILEIINTEPEDWIMSHSIFEELYENKDLFLSKKARYTFSGYALSQLKRIKSHKKWLLEPPTKQPKRSEFGLSDYQKLNKSDLGAASKLIANGNILDDRIMELYKQERQYQAALQKWKQYQDWTTNRNKKRAKLESNFGYDVKHAMHLVRLLTMCKEILSEGKVIVRRPDAELLRGIRSGSWEYDKLLEWAEQADQEVVKLYNSSSLPDEPRYKELDELCQRLTKRALLEL